MASRRTRYYSTPYPKPSHTFGAWAESQRSTPMWRAWRQEVYRRDGFCCVMCRIPRTVKRGQAGKLEPHHILRKADRPDLIFVVDNGVTLCHDCHKNRVTGNEAKFVLEFQAYVRSKAISVASGGITLTGFEKLLATQARQARRLATNMGINKRAARRPVG